MSENDSTSPGPSRRSQRQRAESTKTALIRAARTLFAERDYAQVPAEEIVALAGVSRGALYHHFGDKLGLFSAMFEQLESEISDELRLVLDEQPDLMSKLVVGIDAFLDVCIRPDVQQIALHDAPSVLGWMRWREIEERHGLGLLVQSLQEAVEADQVIAIPVVDTAHLILSALIEASMLIAHAPDQQEARTRAKTVLLTMLAGLLKD